MVEEIMLGREAGDYERWRFYMTEALQRAAFFEIHCWQEEREAIALALNFGEAEDDERWPYGVIVRGAVTDDFRAMVLTLKRPADDGLYAKMTPFFSLFLDDTFSSEHYGTELHFLP